MITLQNAWLEGRKALETAAIDTAALDARLLLELATGMRREVLISHSASALESDKYKKYQLLINRRSQREPISHILGKKEFWSLDFTVSHATLTPRPDSETLIETALMRIPNRAAPLKILDLGTGSGCLLLALLSELPTASGTGVDKSPEALKIAQGNAVNLRLEHRACFVESDWDQAVSGTFDIVISNPPYIAEGSMEALHPEVALFEPRLALTAGSEGLDAYKDIAPVIKRRLNADGFALLEIGEGQEMSVVDIMEQAGIAHAETKSDLAGIPRALRFTHNINHNRVG